MQHLQTTPINFVLATENKKKLDSLLIKKYLIIYLSDNYKTTAIVELLILNFKT